MTMRSGRLAIDSFTLEFLAQTQRFFELALDLGKRAAHAMPIEFVLYSHQKTERSVYLPYTATIASTISPSVQ